MVTFCELEDFVSEPLIMHAYRHPAGVVSLGEQHWDISYVEHLSVASDIRVLVKDAGDMLIADSKSRVFKQSLTPSSGILGYQHPAHTLLTLAFPASEHDVRDQQDA